MKWGEWGNGEDFDELGRGEECDKIFWMKNHLIKKVKETIDKFKTPVYTTRNYNTSNEK